MKIIPSAGTIDLMSRVREKQDQGAVGDQNRRNSYGQNREKQQNEEEAPREASFEEVQAEVESFRRDQQNQAVGLTATSEGSGPGLRVILKDGTGTVIRQLSGDEFLKLREATAFDGSSRGKLLDHKA